MKSAKFKISIAALYLLSAPLVVSAQTLTINDSMIITGDVMHGEGGAFADGDSNGGRDGGLGGGLGGGFGGGKGGGATTEGEGGA